MGIRVSGVTGEKEREMLRIMDICSVLPKLLHVLSILAKYLNGYLNSPPFDIQVKQTYQGTEELLPNAI